MYLVILDVQKDTNPTQEHVHDQKQGKAMSKIMESSNIFL